MKKLSLFTRLTLLVILAAVVIVFITIGVLHWHFSRMRNLPATYRYLLHGIEFIVDNLDMNDTAAVRNSLDTMGLSLRYRGTSSEWCSSERVPDLATALSRAAGKKTFWYGKRIGTVISNKKGTFVVLSVSPFENITFKWDIFTIWIIILFLFFGCIHLLIRRWMNPVRVLQHGVTQVSRGRFDIQLRETNSGELGQLIRLFNTMAQRIRNDMKSRDQLLRDISHELRSPLARMLVALEFIPEGNIRQTFKRNISALEVMITSILENERLDSPFGKVKLHPLDIKKMLADIVESRSTESVPIQLEACGTVIIPADSERMRMALANIIDNAVKYSRPNAGRIDIFLHAPAEDDMITLTVQDHGIGIPTEDIPFIFEPFYRVDKARRHSSGGYGLGLHLTKKIIEAHTGTVTVSSTPETGTVITVRLPRQSPPQAVVM